MTDRGDLDKVKGTPCIVCGQPSDPCHIKSKGSGGCMNIDNILGFCRIHHRMQHDKGWSYMIDRYPELKQILQQKGWAMQNIFGIPKLKRIK